MRDTPVRQRFSARITRSMALAWKETLQIVRDPSSILMAFVLPLMLLLLFGYGVSLDLRGIRLGVVSHDDSSLARSLEAAFSAGADVSELRDLPLTVRRVARLTRSDRNESWFHIRHYRDARNPESLLVGGRLHAVLVIPEHFSRDVLTGRQAPLQLLVRGTDPNTAELVRGYVAMCLHTWFREAAASRALRIMPRLVMQPRVWYNPEMESRTALIPGSIAVIMALIGTMLTALVVAREWERGTMEALLATPLTRMELLAGKLLPYFLLGLVAMIMVTAVATVFMGIPLRGSFWVLVMVSAAFLSYAVGLGILISSAVRSQFVATQAALIIGYLPALIMSGLIFRIQSMPTVLRYATYLFAPRYFVSSLRTVFLVGNVWDVIVPDTVTMFGFGALFLVLSLRKIPVTLE